MINRLYHPHFIDFDKCQVVSTMPEYCGQYSEPGLPVHHMLATELNFPRKRSLEKKEQQ